MPRYGIERGDVLLSLQLVLTREEEYGRPDLRDQAPEVTLSVGNLAAAAVSTPLAPRPPAVSTPPAVRRFPAAPRRPLVMVDPTTGAGTVAALRRDLARDMAGGGPEGKVVGLEIQTLDQFRLVLGPGAADDVIRGLVEVAPFALDPRDRVYRFGQDKLILWLAASQDTDIEKARSGLEGAVTRFLADRGFPEVKLVARKLDPGAIAR